MDKIFRTIDKIEKVKKSLMEAFEAWLEAPGDYLPGEEDTLDVDGMEAYVYVDDWGEPSARLPLGDEEMICYRDGECFLQKYNNGQIIKTVRI